MDNKISINKIIADIKATKGNRSGCQGLSSSLESDGYITSICKWVRATSPDRINALVEHVEKQDAALIAWEKTMMEVCGEDGPASVANEIRSLRALRDTAIQALKSQVEQLAAENVALKAFGDKLSEMHNALNGEGTGIQGRAEVACQQVALEAAMEEFDDIKTPATDAYLAGIKASAGAKALEDFADFNIKSIDPLDNEFTDALKEVARAARGFARQLREEADK